MVSKNGVRLDQFDHKSSTATTGGRRAYPRAETARPAIRDGARWDRSVRRLEQFELPFCCHFSVFASRADHSSLLMG